MIFKSDDGPGELNGFLAPGCHVRGELHFDDTFRVDGKVTGKVVSDGSLIVGEQGEVDGTTEVARIFVSGTVRGTVQASGRIEVAPGGRLLADIETPVLVIEDGGVFQGHCAMTRALGRAPASAPARDAAPGRPVPGER